MRFVAGRGVWALAGALAIAVLAAAARDARGGSLDPVGTPGPTMQSLDQMPPDWMFTLSAQSGCGSARFECVMSRVICNPNCHFAWEGVLDRETGLVWQSDLANWNAALSWEGAMSACLNYRGGGRAGWRLPTLGEASSLLDPTVIGPSESSLPPGHPFTSLPVALWVWTSSWYEVVDGSGDDVYMVYYRAPGFVPGFALGTGGGGGGSTGAWCVRGAS